MTVKQIAALKALAVEATVFLDRLDRAGLHRSARYMGAVVGEIGWEIAGMMLKKTPKPPKRRTQEEGT